MIRQKKRENELTDSLSYLNLTNLPELLAEALQTRKMDIDFNQLSSDEQPPIDKLYHEMGIELTHIDYH